MGAHALAGAQAPFLRRLAQVSVRSLPPPPLPPSSLPHLLTYWSPPLPYPPDTAPFTRPPRSSDRTPTQQSPLYYSTTTRLLLLGLTDRRATDAQQTTNLSRLSRYSERVGVRDTSQRASPASHRLHIVIRRCPCALDVDVFVLSRSCCVN